MVLDQSPGDIAVAGGVRREGEVKVARQDKERSSGRVDRWNALSSGAGVWCGVGGAWVERGWRQGGLG